eukprot:3033568-Pleurochrysis_carterae.AAC.1
MKLGRSHTDSHATAKLTDLLVPAVRGADLTLSGGVHPEVQCETETSSAHALALVRSSRTLWQQRIVRCTASSSFVGSATSAYHCLHW